MNFGFIYSLILSCLKKRFLPPIHDLKADNMQTQDMGPILRLFRLMSEVRLILGIEVITVSQINWGLHLVEQLEDIVAVSIFLHLLITGYLT